MKLREKWICSLHPICNGYADMASLLRTTLFNEREKIKSHKYDRSIEIMKFSRVYDICWLLGLDLFPGNNFPWLFNVHSFFLATSWTIFPLLFCTLDSKGIFVFCTIFTSDSDLLKIWQYKSLKIFVSPLKVLWWFFH